MSGLCNDWFQIVVSRCQVMAGQIAEQPPSVLLAEIERLSGQIPSNVSVREQLLVRGLLGQALARMLMAANLTDQPGVARAMMSFNACGITDQRWRREFDGILQCARRAVDQAREGGVVHVERALRIIRDKFADSSLSLRSVASELAISPSHLSRLLNKQTGQGFMGHLHAHRVGAARRLIVESVLSVKQTASAVGYQSVTQLERHFKRAHGAPPTLVRAGLAKRNVNKLGVES